MATTDAQTMRLSKSRWALYISISVQYHSPRHQAGRSFEAAWSSSHVFWSRILDKCHAANTDVAKICQGDRPMEEHSESVAPMLMLLCLRTIGDSVDWVADIFRKGKMHAKRALSSGLVDMVSAKSVSFHIAV